MHLSLERSAAWLEYELSKAAAIPVLGAIPALLKVALGIIQTLGGLFAMIAASIFCCFPTSKQLFKRGFTHFVNGMANVLAGSLEAVPFLGTAIYFCRKKQSLEGTRVSPVIITGQEHMIFVGYAVIEKHPIKVYDPKNNQSLNDVNDSGNIDKILHTSPMICV